NCTNIYFMGEDFSILKKKQIDFDDDDDDDEPEKSHEFKKSNILVFLPNKKKENPGTVSGMVIDLKGFRKFSYNIIRNDLDNNDFIVRKEVDKKFGFSHRPNNEIDKLIVSGENKRTLETLKRCIYKNYFLFDCYKLGIHSFQLYELVNMKLEQNFTRIEDSSIIKQKFNLSTFTV